VDAGEVDRGGRLVIEDRISGVAAAAAKEVGGSAPGKLSAVSVHTGILRAAKSEIDVGGMDGNPRIKLRNADGLIQTVTGRECCGQRRGLGPYAAVVADYHFRGARSERDRVVIDIADGDVGPGSAAIERSVSPDAAGVDGIRIGRVHRDHVVVTALSGAVVWSAGERAPGRAAIGGLVDADDALRIGAVRSHGSIHGRGRRRCN